MRVYGRRRGRDLSNERVNRLRVIAVVFVVARVVVVDRHRLYCNIIY